MTNQVLRFNGNVPFLFIVFFFLLFIVQTTRAQSSQLKIKFEGLGVNEGLSNTRVTSIVQDSKGYLWIGTDDGLNKYDGYQFTSYRNIPGDSNSFFNNTIKSVFEDSRGTLWVSTDSRGFYYYNRKTDHFIPIKEFYKKGILETIRESSNKDLWVAGNVNGFATVARLNSKTHEWEIFPILSSVLPASDIVQKSDSTYWVSIKNLGLFEWNIVTNTLSDNISKSEKISTRIDKIVVDTYGNTWFGSGDGLYKLQKKATRFIAYKANPKSNNSLPVNTILDITQEGKYLWIGTENGGVSRMNILTHEITTFATDKNDPYSITDNSVWVVYKDHQDRIWIGTFSKGLCVYDKLKYKFQELDVKLENDIVNSIWQDHKKRIWIGTEDGLVMKDGNHVYTFKHDAKRKKTIDNNPVLSIFQDSRNKLWVGTWDGGLNQYDEEKDVFIHYESLAVNHLSYFNPNVYSIKEQASTKKLLVAGYQGLGILEDEKNKRFKKFIDEEYLDNNYLTAVCEDHAGYIWLGSHLQLNRIDPKNGERLRFYYDKASGAGIFVNCILEDSQQRLWVGTNQGLKLLVNGEPQAAYTTQDGLPSDVIRSIAEDNAGNLWLGTSHGISNFKHKREEFVNYDVNDGLLSNDFKINSIFKSEGGAIFIGGKGINVFYPDSIHTNPHVPTVFINDLKVFNRSVKLGADDHILKEPISETTEIFLHHNHSVFSLDFVALNFTASNKNEFAYKLEGFDEEWSYSGNQRSATYTNIDPGTYTFRVKASNNDGLWNEAGTSLVIHILPPWWATWWVRLIMTLGVLGVFILIYQIRVRNRYTSKLIQLTEKLESEKHLVNFLMDNLPALIYLKDKDSKFVRVSKHMAKYFKHDVDEMLGKTDFDFQDKQHAQEAFDDEQEIIRTGKGKEQYLEREAHDDGTEKWVSTIKQPLFNSSGEIVGTFGISTDVTQVKKLNEELLLQEEEIKAQNEDLHKQRETLAQQNQRLQTSEEELKQNLEELNTAQDIIKDINHALEASENQIRQIFNGVPAMIFQFKRTVDGTLSFPVVSHGSRQIYGLDPEVLMKDAMSIIEKIHPEDLPIYEKSFSKSLENPNEEVKVELRAVVDGKVKWIQASTMPELLEDGSTLWSGILLDISKRKEAELELIRTREMLEQTNHTARIGGWEADLATNEVTWSEVTKEIHEVPRDFKINLATGLNFYKEGESRRQITKAIEQITKDGIPFDLKLQIVTTRGRDLWVRVMGKSEFVNNKCKRLYGVFQDVDEQIKANNALVESENNFRQINETIEEVFWLYDVIRKKYIYVSPTCEKVWEMSQANFYEGTAFIECVLEDDRELVIAAAKSLPEKKSYEIEYRVRARSGKVKWVREKSFAILNENEVYIRNSGICTDITEKKQIQQQIEKLSVVAEKTTNGVLIADSKGRALWANQGYLDMMEIELDQLLNKRPSRLFNADDSEFLNSIDNVINSNYNLEFELTTFKKNKKWVKLSSTVIVNESGEPLQQIEVLTDITLLKQTELELQQKNKELIISQNEIALQNNKLIEQSEELASQNEELIQSAEEIATQRDQLSIQNNKLQDAQTIIEEQNQEIRSRNENLEDEVAKRTREIVEYNHQLEQFAFISAHNLRAPVARILGLGQILALPTHFTGEKDDIFEKLIRTTEELDTVVRDLNKILEIRKESNQPVSEINLYREVLLTESSLQHEIDASHATIIKNFSSIETLKTVKPYFDSILYNMISNAIKYRHPLRDPLLTIQSELVDGYVCIRFADNGLGIDLKIHREKMFMLYKRFHFHRDGKGLGLYLVKNQIDSMGGKIEVESKVDEGTTFKIYFKSL